MQNIPLPIKPKVIQKEDNRAVFEIEGCYPGYGITLGNALRRVLLSSLPGAAVTGFKIKGAQHEFSTIPGVAEDAIEIILNLKKIRFKLYNDEPQTVFLSAKGVKTMMAGDIKVTSDIEVINKNAKIVTLTDKKTELEMEIKVEKGLGFIPVERRKKEKLEIGMIAIDAIFTPVLKANFEVENMRVGERTDFNRLKIDIETDGSLSPEEAFGQATQILVEQFKLFLEVEKSEEQKEKISSQESDEDFSKTKIDDLKLSTRTINSLVEGGIKTLGGLVKKSETSLKEIEGMGDKGIKEIKKVFKKYGFEMNE
ncbi:MAG: DNA-directed RNA polymerase subunit alpha [Candidatus Portnoybacteria bacterium RBG_19FT_COMBO_36_7]|uniref:DNA-directed RNA polymerase subunit alpha n=1 Tax=Candidatus Portnoybacteria bacterium RBG_19FT_COMBO_36_7 TaxID=1801992 RepID=A0A1G2FAQ4_9BACT|nr:MAG: DNA-directed RNA polymerase subunit alpha [Candidatus Portnoybacteria bacterium RBG_19FT_COMBO_36_7]